MADALMLAIGEPEPEPFVYTRIPEPGLTLNQYYRGGGLPNQPPAGWGSQAWKDHLEDLANYLTALMRRRSRAAGFSGFVKGKIY